MDRGVGAAARLLPESSRKDLAIQVLAGSVTVSDLAAQHEVSRKFVYQQTHKACAALDDAAIASSALRFMLGNGSYRARRKDAERQLPCMIGGRWQLPCMTEQRGGSYRAR